MNRIILREPEKLRTLLNLPPPQISLLGGLRTPISPTTRFPLEEDKKDDPDKFMGLDFSSWANFLESAGKGLKDLKIRIAPIRDATGRVVEGERIPPQWIVEAEQVRSGINVARYFYNILTTSNIFAIGSKREKTRWRDELLNVLRGYEKSDDKFKRSFAQELRPKIEILHLPDGEHTRRFIDKGVP
ncbi:hypothetical protein, partial [Candidatus Hakubella thermalkaliphila]